MYMRLIVKSLKTQPLHSPFADNIYHFWRLSKKYPHLFFHPLENQGKWEENAWSYDVADCIDKLKNALRTSLKTPPKRPCRHHQGQKNLVLTSADEGTFWVDLSPYQLLFTGLSVVNSLYTAIPKRTSLVSYFVQSQFVISTKKLAVCLVDDDVGEGYYSVRTPREKGRKTHRDHRGQWWKSAITRPLWPRFVDRCNVVSRTYGSPRW